MLKRLLLPSVLIPTALVFGLGLSSVSIAAPAKTKKAAQKAPKIITTKAGLKIQDWRVGKGAVAKTGQKVTVNYRGTFTNGTKFDESYGRAPFEFTLGGGQVIKGWDQGVAGMRVGGKRKLIVPSRLGYGDNDYGPIPGKSTLIFTVELLKVG